jgi:hypothetical protein
VKVETERTGPESGAAEANGATARRRQ